MVGVWGHEWLWKEKDTCQRYCRERTRQLTELEEEIEEGQAIKNDTEVSGQRPVSGSTNRNRGE